MDWFSHYMYAFILGRKVKFDRLEMMALLIASLLPDVDFIVGILGIEYFRQYHRVFTHSFFIAPALGVVIICVLYAVQRRNLFIPVMTGLSVHLLLDIFNLPRSSLEYFFPNASFNKGEYDMGTAYFWPVIKERFSLHETLNYPNWAAVIIFFTIILIGAGSFIYFLKRGIKPWYPWQKEESSHNYSSFSNLNERKERGK